MTPLTGTPMPPSPLRGQWGGHSPAPLACPEMGNAPWQPPLPTKGVHWHGPWEVGMGAGTLVCPCGHICQGMPSAVWAKSSALLPLSSCPPVLEGRKTPLLWGGTFSPQSQGTMAGFKEEYHLLWRVIDGAMCLVNISASLESLLFTWKSTTNRKVEGEMGLSPLQGELSNF